MIDLHAHSTASDGSLSPEALIEYAIGREISVLALTDHDCIDGIAPAMAFAKSKPITLIPGVELSVMWGNTPLHIIGLGIDTTNSALIRLLKAQFEARTIRAKAIAEKLHEQGVLDAYEKANAIAQNGLITRPHFAQILINEGKCKDMKQAFKKYLKRGRLAYVRMEWVSMEEGIRSLNDAGGKVILAHPLRYGLTNTKLRCLLGDFKAQGGMALEVISGLSTDSEIAHLSALCREFDLRASQGSDFHGPTMTPHVMGRLKSLPPTCRFVLDAHEGEN